MPSMPIRVRLLWLFLAGALLLAAAGCDGLPIDWDRPLVPDGQAPSPTEAPRSDTGLHINEVLSRNTGSLVLRPGRRRIWIELRNAGDTPVPLLGIGLSDSLRNPMKWTFPDLVLAPGGYLLVYADGGGADASGDDDGVAAGESAADGGLHAGFRLSGAGEELVLTAPDGQVLDQWTIPVLPDDISYGLDPMGARAGQPDVPRLFFGAPTPGRQNGPDGRLTADQALPAPVSTLHINEFVTRNASFPDEDGDLSDWVELVNEGTDPLDLEGFALTDDPGRPDKWRFPALRIEPGQHLVLWLSGKEKAWNGPGPEPGAPLSPHAPFRLGGDDAVLLLLDERGRILSRATLEALPLGVSRGRVPAPAGSGEGGGGEAGETWAYFPLPSPGRPNDGVGFPDLRSAASLDLKPVWISEVLAQDAAMRGNGDGDWIELYNNAGAPLALDGYALTDDPGQPGRWPLSGIVMDPGEYRVVAPDTFGISVRGEVLLLMGPDGRPVDALETGWLRPGVSSGRVRGTEGEPTLPDRWFFPDPTKGKANTTLACQGIAAAPAIRVADEAGRPLDGLYAEGPVTVSLQPALAGDRVTYTLDGSEPTASSKAYEGPFVLSRSAVVRAAAFDPPGGSGASPRLPGRPSVRTVLMELRHDLPVLSVAMDPRDFDGPSGLWTLFTSDMERPAEIAFFEAGGREGVRFRAGLALHGQYSRKELQKSMEINLRRGYGDPEVTYPFFPGNEVSTFRRLVLRTSGQDWKISKLRDAYMTRIVEGYTALDIMAVRFCAVYVNGAYYGLYEIRENADETYMAAHHGADPDQVDIIKGNNIVREGDNRNYQALLKYVREHDLRNPEAYAKVLGWIDEESLMDFVIVQSFYNNADSGNKKFWRPRTEDGQWRWILFDLDWGLFPGTYTWNMLSGDLLDPAGHGSDNIFSTLLQVRLLENPDFREAFLQRYAWYLNEVFRPDRMVGILDGMAAEIRSEMPRQIARWGRPGSVEAWEKNVATLRRISLEKRDRTKGILRNSFGLGDADMARLFPGDDP